MNICVIGGAGYICFPVVEMLMEWGYNTLGRANLLNGDPAAVEAAGKGKAKFYQADLARPQPIIDIFKGERVEGIMHFAASAYVGESVTDPRKYYRNNVANTLNMLDAMKVCGIKKLVFSSTC